MRDLAKTALTASLAAAEFKKVETAAKRELENRFAADGTDRARVKGDDGDDYGTVTYAQGKTAASVTDPAVFAAWVADRYPEAIVTTVDEAWRARLLAACTRSGEPVDPATGEEIPGVDVRRGAPYVSIRATDTAKDRMAEVIAEIGLPEIGGVT